MAQVTWRTPDELLERVRHAASSSGRSVNEWITRVLDAATAGLLAEPSGRQVTRPPAEALEDAKQAAGQGTPLSDLVSDGRR
jgi:Arc-like DNA binding domain